MYSNGTRIIRVDSASLLYVDGHWGAFQTAHVILSTENFCQRDDRLVVGGVVSQQMDCYHRKGWIYVSGSGDQLW